MLVPRQSQGPEAGDELQTRRQLQVELRLSFHLRALRRKSGNLIIPLRRQPCALKIYLLSIFKSSHSVGTVGYKKTQILLYFYFIHIFLQLCHRNEVPH